MSVYKMGPRAPLYTCRGRAVGLLHAWQGGYAKTVSGYDKRVQHSPIRPLPSVYRCDNCGSTFSKELVFLRCLLSFAINVSPHLAPSQSMLPTRTGPRPMRVSAQSACSLLLNRSCRCGLIFSALAWSFCKAINVSPHPSTTDSQRRRRTGPATRLTRGI